MCGITMDGSSAEYIFYRVPSPHQTSPPRGPTESMVGLHHKLRKICNVMGDEATLLKPAAYAIHRISKLKPPVGIEGLLLGGGPTGIVLCQLLQPSCASKVFIAALKGSS